MPKLPKSVKARAIAVAVLLAAIVSTVVLYLVFSKNDYRHTIPEEAKAVIKIDCMQLPDRMAAADFVRSTFGGEVKGIDFTQPLYAFVTPNEYIGLTAAVSDKGEWEATLAVRLKEKTSSGIEESDGLTWTWINDSWLVAWDSDRLLALGPGVKTEGDELRQIIIALMKASEGFTGTDAFKRLEQEKSGMAFYASLDVLPTPYSLLFRMQLPPETPADAVQLYGVLAQSGEAVKTGNEAAIRFDCSVESENEEVRTALSRYDSRQSSGQSARLAAPAEKRERNENAPLLSLAYSGRGEDLVKTLRKDATMRGFLLALNRVVDADKMLSQTAGLITFEADSLQKDGTPYFCLLADTRSKTLFADADYWLQSAAGKKDVSLVREAADRFRLSGEKGDLCFGLNEAAGVLYFASPSQRNKAEGQPTSFYFPVGKDTQISFYLNLEKLFSIPALSQNGMAALLGAILPGRQQLRYEAERGKGAVLTIQ